MQFLVSEIYIIVFIPYLICTYLKFHCELMEVGTTTDVEVTDIQLFILFYLQIINIDFRLSCLSFLRLLNILLAGIQNS